MKKNKKEFRMPDGTYTSSAIKMSRAWKRIYKPICDEFGVRVIGFDPNICFSYGSHSFDLPTDIARKITNLINRKDSMFQE